MLNPLFTADENSLKVQYEEVRFGFYEIDAFKGRYLNIMALLKSAQRLPTPAPDHEEKAKRGLEKIAATLRTRRLHSQSKAMPTSLTESSPLLPKAKEKDDVAETENGEGEPGSLMMTSASLLTTYSTTTNRTASSGAESLDATSTRSVASASTNGVRSVLSRMEKPFPDLFNDELHRVQTICAESILNCAQMLSLAEEALSKQVAPLPQVQSNAYRVELKDIYQKLHQVSQFAISNHLMATRILHSPVVFNSRFGPRIRSDLQQELRLLLETDERQLQEMISRVESLFSKYFGVGDANVARFELLTYVTNKRPELTPSLALLLGFVAASVIFSVSFVFLSPLGLAALEKEGLGRIYRGLSLLNMIPWLNLVVLLILRANRVNYILLFDMDHETRRYHDPIHLAHRACVGTLALIVNLIACLGCLYLQYDFLACACPAIMLPLYLAAIYTSPMIQTMVNQTSYRNILLSFLGLCTPTFPITFRTDCITSLAKPLGDLARLCCHSIFWDEWGLVPPEERICAVSPVLNKWIIPILAMYPLLIRMIQNLWLTYSQKKTWPYFANALKYAFAHQVVIISTLRPTFLTVSPVFLTVFVLTSLFTFLWDVYMDWGLMRCRYYLLRDRLMLPNKVYYYGAIVTDFLLRFTWTLTLVSSGYLATLSVPTILIPLGPNVPANFIELIRRAMWCLLRVENEHLNNTQQWRKVDFVPLYFFEDDQGNDVEEEKQNRETRQAERRKTFFAVIRVVSFVFAAISFAVWTLRIDEDDLANGHGVMDSIR